MLTKIDTKETEGQLRDTRIKEILSQTQIVDHLVSLLDKYVGMVKKCFNNDVLFERGRQLAFEQFMNRDRHEQNRISMSEILAVFTDSILRKGNNNKGNGDEGDKVLEKVV